jgi:hypothetical protein
MSSELVCQVARNWVDAVSFHTHLFGVVYFAIASVREFLDTPSGYMLQPHILLCPVLSCPFLQNGTSQRKMVKPINIRQAVPRHCVSSFKG